jgi:hypothetical protein
MSRFNTSLIIFGAVEIMKTSFGGTDVKIISQEMYRNQSDNTTLIGILGVDIEIEGYKVFLSYSIAEDMCLYGQHVADNFVFNILKGDYKRKIRKEKIKEIHPDIK